jgi:hypothetical protein
MMRRFDALVLLVLLAMVGCWNTACATDYYVAQEDALTAHVEGPCALIIGLEDDAHPVATASPAPGTRTVGPGTQ